MPPKQRGFIRTYRGGEMKNILGIIFILMSHQSAFASSMSELDLMTREEIVNYFSIQQITIDPSKDISALMFVTPHQVICDLEVAAQVTYKNKKNKLESEACYVCFSFQNKGQKSQYLDPEITYCLE